MRRTSSDMRYLRSASALLFACCLTLERVCLRSEGPAAGGGWEGHHYVRSGNGEATLYVSGPGVAIKRKVQLGQDIQLSGDELKNAGRYFVSLDGSDSATFFVTAGPGELHCVSRASFAGTGRPA